MNDTIRYIAGIGIFSLPISFAAVGVVMMFVSGRCESANEELCRKRHSLMRYFLLIAMTWASFFSYFLVPTTFNFISLLVSAMVISAQILILLYNMLREHRNLFAEEGGKRNSKTVVAVKPETSVSQPTVFELNRRTFEMVMVKNRLFADSNLTLNDLLERFDADQPTLSSFIMDTYGMNFRQYLNNLRIKEIERLLSLSANKRKKPADFIIEVGFGSMRSYQRSRNSRMKRRDRK